VIQKKVIVIICVSFLILSAAILTQLEHLVSGNMLFPEQTPIGIKINNGGLIDGTEKIQAIGNTFTLMDNIDQTIVILGDGIVLDGAGHTLKGNGNGVGVFLQGRNLVTIRNLTITDFQWAIKLTWSTYGDSAARSVTISHNTLARNEYGIAFYDSLSGSEISDNNFINNKYGVYSPNNVIFRNNHFINNGCPIFDDYTINNVDSSNTVNDRPICYWVDKQNETVPSDVGWVVLKNCKNITVEELNLDSNNQWMSGLALFNTNASTIKGNTVSNKMIGITLQGSNHNLITDNHISSCTQNGIYISSSSNNNILENQITTNLEDGITIEYFSYCNTISENHIEDNDEAGIAIRILFQTFPSPSFAETATIYQNNISRNGVGIWINNGISITVVLNNITENYDWGMKLEGSQKDNTIHHNNFINNNCTQKLQVCIAGFFNQTLPPLPINTSSPDVWVPPKIEFVAGGANTWDDGKAGNYWSDYMTRYPNATEVGKTRIGNTLFYINENNIDHCPLMAPVDTFERDLALSNGKSVETSNQQNSAIYFAVIVSVVSVAILGLCFGVYFKMQKSKQPLSSPTS
jgi:parallel beta-helix repeat protein